MKNTCDICGLKISKEIGNLYKKDKYLLKNRGISYIKNKYTSGKTWIYVCRKCRHENALSTKKTLYKFISETKRNNNFGDIKTGILG